MYESMDKILGEYIASLKPYLNQLVIAGGWVPYIYSKTYSSENVREPLITYDFDAVIPRHGFLENDKSLDRVILDAGFEYVFASLDNPPVVKYIKKLAENKEIEIEFIVNESGNNEGVKRIGSINAQALRYIGLLTDSHWELSLLELGFADDGYLRIPSPARFIFHKALTAPRRRQSNKTAKDLYYIFYVLEAFSAWREDTLMQINQLSKSHNQWKRKAHDYLAVTFEDIDSWGLDLLLSQKPQTAFSEMTEDQFKQYALHIISELINALKH